MDKHGSGQVSSPLLTLGGRARAVNPAHSNKSNKRPLEVSVPWHGEMDGKAEHGGDTFRRLHTHTQAQILSDRLAVPDEPAVFSIDAVLPPTTTTTPPPSPPLRFATPLSLLLTAAAVC